MKLLYKSEKYLKHSRSVARHVEKRRSFRRKKQKLYRRNTERMSISEKREWYLRQNYKIIIKAPINLSFLEDPESVVNFVTKAENALRENKSLFVDMKLVEKIDYSTITALLAVLYISRKRGIKINGNMPNDIISKNILTKSGFLYTLFSKNPDAGHKHDISADNQLFTFKKADLKIVGEIEKIVSQRIFAKNKKLPGLYTTLGELMDNTITWAAENEGENERWWLSINYDQKTKKVSFVFMDYGVGIFTSLLRKTGQHPVKNLLEKAKQSFGNEATEKHLKSIVTESAGKTYKLKKGRGQGIYGIYQTLQRREIENLYIVSNNTFGDVSKNNYKRLKNQLNGTLYYWEICDKNI